MIKGVQRQVIEVSRPESRYFERALLVIRPDCTADDALLRAEAQQYLKRAGHCNFLARQRRMRRIKAVGMALLYTGAGALVSFLLFGR